MRNGQLDALPVYAISLAQCRVINLASLLQVDEHSAARAVECLSNAVGT